VIFPGVIRGGKTNTETAENEVTWGSHSSLNDIHVMFIAPSQMAVY
jgi:hypothetical protein